ncbi:FAD/NAD(P)-binding domain-containing protein [Annulohypoxylon maeteangense]|uniref:FAD/NAD(P)-binding domain-containing protein n=1 Tax=Annulohypoxylon maeteangense TaxID=1927788 RepID=UPI0020078C2B|nr:FAD/NAD(P)-binding domain-containing protein [Annulohypoxylon maeteangense]KAI0883193.1 FAD/NAD(P)-binding domain-containing protein [Annulohypoxylon maeteangense]
MGSTSPTPPRFDVNKIAIVGAGPSGLAVAKYLLAQNAFAQVVVFEQQAEVGGVWNYSATARPIAQLPVPQVVAFPGWLEEPVYAGGEGGNGDEKGKPLFPTPMYDDLNTNIPHTIMKYSDFSFRDGCEIFPRREDVQAYLVQYAKDVRHHIKFSTQVSDISLREKNTQKPWEERDQWDVSTTDLVTGEKRKDVYDAIVVASGHYSTPYIPDGVADIKAFHEAHPGVISHSKMYRNAESYRGKKVVVVGTGASGLDIAAQIRRVSQTPLIVSAREGATEETLEHFGGGKFVQVGQIKRFLVEERGVEFYSLDDEDEEGNTVKVEGKEKPTIIEKDIDAVLFCTGYLFTFPFLTTLTDPPLVTDGRRVHGLAKHFLHINHPTLTFPSLPIKVIPFPLAEAQGAVFARLWSNTLPLPSRSALEAMEREDGDQKDPGKYHVFPKGGDGQYINELHDWVMRDGGGKEGGKEPPYWDGELLWQRGIYIEAKMQFEKTGKSATTLEELGFRYEPQEPKTVEDVKGTGDVAG